MGNISDFLKKPEPKPEEKKKENPVSQLTEEKKANKYDRIITLADGTKVNLDELEREKERKAEEEKALSKRHIILADGTRVELDEIKKNDKQDENKQFKLVTGKCGQRAIGYRSKTLDINRVENHLSTYVVPDWLREPTPEPEDDLLNERQKRYKSNVLTSEDLRKPTPKKIKSNNRQGLSRYIFMNELRACRNGLIYYSLPLVINVIFLIFNVFKYNFWANILFSVVALFDVLMIRLIFKSEKSILLKVIFTILLIAFNVGLYFLGTLIPGLYDLIYIPYTLKLFLIVLCIYHFGKFYVGFGLTYAADCNLDFGNTVQINAGKPRCGKTSTAVQDAFVLAKLKWEQLQYDMWLWKSREKEIFRRNDKNELLEYEEIKLAYNFYIMRPCVPCLWSNIGIFDRNGRAAHVITLEHLKGIERLPVYSVVLLDEIGAMLKADDGVSKSGHEKPLDVSDMFRLGGHFVKWVVLGCEQDFNHIYIDCRRVVGFNRVIMGQEWVCRPVLLYNIFRFLKMLKADSLDKGIKGNPKYARFLKWLEKFVRSIGYRRIKYSYAQNTETGAGMLGASDEAKFELIGGVRVRWCASNLIALYDDRAYKQKYPSYFDKEIRGDLHKALHIDGLDKKTAQYVNSTTALTEKWQAVEEEVKKIA